MKHEPNTIYSAQLEVLLKYRAVAKYMGQPNVLASLDLQVSAVRREMRKEQLAKSYNSMMQRNTLMLKP